MNPARPGARHAELPSSALSTGEYVVLVLVLAGAIIATSLFVAWAYQQRGILAPNTVPTLRRDDHGPGPDPTT